MAASFLADGKLVAADGDLDRIAQRRDLHDLELRALDEAEVHQVATERTRTVQLDDGGAIAYRHISRVFMSFPLSYVLSEARRM